MKFFIRFLIVSPWLAAEALGASPARVPEPERNLVRPLTHKPLGQFARDDLQTGDVPQGIVSGDFNRDGLTDLAVANAFNDNVVLLIGDGRGEFSIGDTLSVDLSPGVGDDLPRDLIAGDFDLDGFEDLVVVNSGNPNFTVDPSLAVLAGKTVSGFEPARFVEFFESGDPELSFSLAAGRLDSGPFADLIVGHSAGNALSVLENEGGLNFETEGLIDIPTSGTGPAAVGLADLNLDGRLDILAANEADLVVLEGLDDEQFAPARVIAAGDDWQKFAVSDFDNNGSLDVAAVDFDRPMMFTFMDVNTEGGFSRVETTPLPLDGASWVVCADFNQDGFEDTAVSFLDDAKLGVLLGNGDGTFDEALTLFSTGLEPRAIATGDFNGDGRIDLATANEGDESVPTNEDVSVILNDIPPSTPLLPIVPEPASGPADLGAGINHARGIGWDPLRSSFWVCVQAELALVEVSMDGRRISTVDTAQHGGFDPADVTVDPSSGDLFFVDRLAARVLRITPAGDLVSSFSTTTAGATRPAGIAFRASDNRLLVSDEVDENVYLFSLAGDLLRVLEADRPLADLAYDPVEGLVWGFEAGSDEVKGYLVAVEQDELVGTVDFTLEAVSKLLVKQPLDGLAFNPSSGRFALLVLGGLLIESTGEGNAMGAVELGLGMSVTAADGDSATGDVWLLDGGTLGTVIRRDPQGVYQVVFSVNTLAAEDPAGLAGLAVDDTSIYVGESREGRLLMFTKSGQALGEVFLHGLEDREIQGIDTDPDSGLLLILVPGRLSEHDLSGDLIRQSSVTQARRFADMSLHADGLQIALYDEARAEIWIVDRDGRFVERGATPAFVPHGFRLGGGSFDPLDPSRHFVLGSGSGVLFHFELSTGPNRTAPLWRLYR